MSDPQVTVDVAQWLAAQAQAATPEPQVLAALEQSGWTPAMARKLIESVFAPRVAALRLIGTPQGRLPDIGGRRLPGVEVLANLTEPRIVLLSGLLPDEDCAALIEAARPRLSRSETVDTDTGSHETHVARTSQGMFFERGENALCQRIEQRIADLFDWPVDHGEGLQVLRYGPGAEYLPHHDYFDPFKSGTPTLTARGGQRVATLLMYLNTPAAGGATVFPDIGFDVQAVRGQAVFFSYRHPDPGSLTLHGGAPVTQGEKWVATKWLRRGRFE